MGLAQVERFAMKKALLAAAALAWPCLSFANGMNPPDRATVIVAVGAAGEAEFGKEFERWAGLWQAAGTEADANVKIVGLTPTNATPDLEGLRNICSTEDPNATAELWLVLIGHGTFDGREARFNLRGPDLSATELAEWLKPFRRPVIIINCASSSSPFLNKLSAPGRLIVTATRSGYEENFARFGRFMAESIADPSADLDKDGQTSVLESFIMASRQVGEFYESEGRLATEHALLDDNGDGLGTSADFFRGVRAVKKPAGGASVDGLRASQIHLVKSSQEMELSSKARARRDDMERAIESLRERKASLPEEEYYQQLERLLLEFARINAGTRKH